MALPAKRIPESVAHLDVGKVATCARRRRCPCDPVPTRKLASR